MTDTPTLRAWFNAKRPRLRPNWGSWWTYHTDVQAWGFDFRTRWFIGVIHRAGYNAAPKESDE
jgi:hypothetical protein